MPKLCNDLNYDQFATKAGVVLNFETKVDKGGREDIATNACTPLTPPCPYNLLSCVYSHARTLVHNVKSPCACSSSSSCSCACLNKKELSIPACKAFILNNIIAIKIIFLPLNRLKFLLLNDIKFIGI